MQMAGLWLLSAYFFANSVLTSQQKLVENLFFSPYVADRYYVRSGQDQALIS